MFRRNDDVEANYRPIRIPWAETLEAGPAQNRTRRVM